MTNYSNSTNLGRTLTNIKNAGRTVTNVTFNGTPTGQKQQFKITSK